MRKDGETYHENEEWLPIFSVEELYKSLEKDIPKYHLYSIILYLSTIMVKCFNQCLFNTFPELTIPLHMIKKSRI